MNDDDRWSAATGRDCVAWRPISNSVSLSGFVKSKTGCQLAAGHHRKSRV